MAFPDVPAAAAGDDVIVDERTVRFERGADGLPVAHVTEHRLARVTTERGQRLAGIAVHYDDTFSAVDDIEVRTKTSAGVVAVVDRTHAVDVPAIVGYALYSDQRALALFAPAVPPGTLVDSIARYTMHSPELFAFGHVFGGSVHTDVARLVVEAPAGWDVDATLEAFGKAQAAPAPATTNDGGVVRRVWEEHDLAARKGQPRGLPAAELHDAILVRLAKWIGDDGVAARGPLDDKALSSTVYGLMKARARTTPAVTALVADLTKGVDEPREKAARLYAYARDHVHYCAIEIGMGGFVPHAADDVRRLGYGDCKDKANLLTVMLKEAGISSSIGTLYSSSWPRPFLLPVVAGNFNHAIVVVDLPGGKVVADPTSRTAGFGELPVPDQDRALLPISDPGSPLMQTPASTAADNAREESYDLNVALDGSASGTFSSTLTGSLALTLRGRLLSAPKKKTNEMILGELSLLHPAVLDDIHVDGTEPPALPTPIHVAGKITRPLVRGGLRGDTALRGSRVLGESALPTIADQHVGPLLLGAPMREHVVVKLRLPHGAVPGTLPPPASAEAAFGSYRAQWSLDGAALVYERTIVVSQRIVDEQALDDARAFFRGALSADASPLVIAFAGDR